MTYLDEVLRKQRKPQTARRVAPEIPAEWRPTQRICEIVKGPDLLLADSFRFFGGAALRRLRLHCASDPSSYSTAANSKGSDGGMRVFRLRALQYDSLEDKAPNS